MTAMKEEESFPRGRSSSTKPALRKVKDRLFKKYKKTKKKPLNSFFEENQIKGRFKKSLSKGNKELEPSHAIRPLTYQSLDEGMVVVGRVREIHPYHLFICLPGKLSAKVPITAISQPYSNSLTRLQKLEITQKDCPPLSDLFTEGQAVICSIVEVKKDGNVLAVNASLDPALVNKERSHHVIRAGHTLVAAVRTVEDHGYTLDTGITGLTTFLKFNQAAKHVELRNQGRPLAVGEMVRCVVTKCATGRSASRAEVSLDPRVMAGAVVSDGNAQTLHPGATVGCTVQQSSKVGLVVDVGRSRAYVEAAQLTNCWTSHKYIQPEEELTATVLYSLPNTDFQITARPTYLTLKDLNRPAAPKLAVGDIIEARVTASGRKGLILCLGQKKDKELGNKGFVSIRRLGEIIPKENIAKKFPKGTIITTKILAYDYMEEIYNCTLEKAKLDQHYVSVAQVKVGDRLTCQVVAVESQGMRLQLGPVRLYAFREHAMDEPCTVEELQRHFCPGDTVDARVLKVISTTRQIYVTLKETLIRSPALMNYEAASRGECYYGTVKKVHTKSNRLIVVFYNDVTGVLNLVGDMPAGDFRVGQLLKCFVKKVDPQQKKLLLSLTKPKGPIQAKQLALGKLYQLVVTDVSDDCLEVSPCDFEGIEGLIPKCHLPEPDRFAEGDFIRAWLYHKQDDIHYFSPNPGIEYFLKNSTLIKPRYRMTCCVSEIRPKEVSLLTSLPDIPTVSVEKKEWPQDSQPRLHQLVRMYVAEYDAASNTLKLSHSKPRHQANVKSNESDETSEKIANEEKSADKSENPKRKKKKKETHEESEPQILSEESKEKKGQSFIVTSEDISKPKGKLEKASKENSWTVEKADLREHSKGCNGSGDFKVDDQSEVHTGKLDSQVNTQEKKGKKTKLKNADKKDDSKKSSSERNQLAENESEEESDLNTSDFDSDDSGDEMVVREKIKQCETVDDDGEDKKKDKKRKKQTTSESESDTKLENKTDKKSKKRKNSVGEISEVEEPKIKGTKTSTKPKPTLSESGFLWDIKPEDLSKPEDADDSNDDEDEDSTKEKKKKKSAAERREAAKEEEARLRRVEQTLLDSESNPQSAEQFDRAVLARPDDDQLWIKYMSHHLQATEIEKARAVGRRALQTINQRLETERLNMWIALLNLEHLFGTQESLKNTLDEALRTNDEFSVYTKMLNIYSQANKAQEAEQLVHTMLRKFRTSPECWVTSCGALMNCGLADKARNLLQRAITALPAKQHVNLLCKFALLENQHGNSEQAQTLFEHILTTYPKRTDIWNVYVDMLVKSEKVDVARQILERATKQKLPPRKMKMLFNKWISFEEKNGTPEKIEHVRKQALAYVNNITNKLDD